MELFIKIQNILLLKNKAVAVEFIRKLSVLLNAGVSINHALDMIAAFLLKTLSVKKLVSNLN